MGYSSFKFKEFHPLAYYLLLPLELAIIGLRTDFAPQSYQRQGERERADPSARVHPIADALCGHGRRGNVATGRRTSPQTSDG